MPTLTDEQRKAIAERDAESCNWLGCCIFVPVVIMLLILASYFGLNHALDFPTDDTIDTEVVSPNGVYVAVIVSRPNGTLAPSEGGAERVLIRRASDNFMPDNEGHINIKPVYHDLAAYNLNVVWKGNRTLIVKTDSCWHGKASKDISEASWNDVKVKYHYCESN